MIVILYIIVYCSIKSENDQEMLQSKNTDQPLKRQKLLALSLSDVVFIMLINVKMPAIVIGVTTMILQQQNTAPEQTSAALIGGWNILLTEFSSRFCCFFKMHITSQKNNQIKWASTWQNLSSEFLTKWDSNQYPPLQRLARKVKSLL